VCVGVCVRARVCACVRGGAVAGQRRCLAAGGAPRANPAAGRHAAPPSPLLPSLVLASAAAARHAIALHTNQRTLNSTLRMPSGTQQPHTRASDCRHPRARCHSRNRAARAAGQHARADAVRPESAHGTLLAHLAHGAVRLEEIGLEEHVKQVACAAGQGTGTPARGRARRLAWQRSGCAARRRVCARVTAVRCGWRRTCCVCASHQTTGPTQSNGTHL
jgi:hypothetical protein